MSVPGAGLLALLRKRSEPEAPQLGVVSQAPPAAASGGSTGNGSSKFEARSSAVHALEQAVAAGGQAAEAVKSAAQGRRIPAGPTYTYDVDVQGAHEAQPQLSVTPVTLINTDFALHHYRQTAVSGSYLCYGLKQGHIRVLSRHSAVRALLKGHSKPLTDLQFATAAAGADAKEEAEEEEDHGSLLASGGQDGQLFVWQLRLDEGEAAIRETQKLHAHFITAAGSAGDVYLSWHATSKRVLAAGVGGKVLLVGVPAEGMEQLEFDLDDDSTPDASVLPGWSGEAVTCLSFSPDGHLLAAGGAEGTVRVWQLEAAAAADRGPSLRAAHSTAVPTGAGSVGAVRWLPTESGWVLLTGNCSNSTLRLWHSGAAGGDWAPLQTLRFQGKGGEQEFFNQLDVVPSQQLVVLADTARKAVYSLHFSGAGAGLRFDYAARFGVALPILSFATHWNPAGSEQGDIPLVELTCVQTTAIQQYSLDPKLCYDAGGAAAEEAEEAGAARAEHRERLGRGFDIQPQPLAAVPMPSEALANGTPRKEQQAAQQQQAEEAEEAAAAAAAASSSSKAAAQAEGAAPLASIPPIPPPPAEEPQEASGRVTPEECPSPAPTPTEQQRLHEAAAAEAAAAPLPALRLLTPSDLLQSVGSRTCTAGRSTPSTDSAAGARAPSPAAAAAPTRRVLQRGDSNAAAVPALPPALEEAEAEAAAEELAAAAASPSPSAALAGAAGPALASGQEAAVAAAVMEQMGGVHKKFVGHVSLMYRELLKAMKSEMSAQAAAQQAATAQLLAAALEAQKQQIEAERAAVLAEERANIERLLTAISGTLNTELPTRLQQAVAGELAGMSQALAASLAPAVQQALAASIPKELGGAVKAGLDKQLPGAVAAGLGKPLQEAFRTAFAKQLVPAFEGATQSMFQQINTAFTTGFEEHLQASESALSEPAKLAAQLATSLTTAQSLASSLSQGQQQLLRAQSIGGCTSDARSPAAAVDVRAELSSLLRASKYEAAFSKALSLQDTATVGWLCAQLDAAAVLGADPCPLSQMVLLSLVQQLSADLTTGLATKLTWIREAAMLINPQDAVLARHLRPVLESVHAALQATVGRVTGAQASSLRLAMHVVHSQLTSS